MPARLLLQLLTMHKGRMKHAPPITVTHRRPPPFLPPLSLTITPHFGSKAKVPHVRRWEALAMARIWIKLWHSSWRLERLERIRSSRYKEVSSVRTIRCSNGSTVDRSPCLGPLEWKHWGAEPGLGQGYKQGFTSVPTSFLPFFLQFCLWASGTFQSI